MVKLLRGNSKIHRDIATVSDNCTIENHDIYKWTYKQ